MNTEELRRLRRLLETGTARAIREAAGLSLSEITAELSVDRSTVHRWERGKRRPRRGAGAQGYLRMLESLSR